MFEVRPTTNAEELRRAYYAIGQYFNEEITDEGIARLRQILPFERMHAAFEDGEIVGGAGAFPFELGPGRRVPVRRCDRRRRLSDASPPRCPARDDGRAAARHP